MPIMKSSLLVAASAGIMLTLGLIHLLYTFRGPNLHPRDPSLIAKMMADPLVLTQETTVWRVWVGLNASLGLGLILFGAVYGYLALLQRALLFRSTFLLALGLIILVSYAAVAKLYFFSSPLQGIVVAGLLYLLGIVLNRA
jgi:hypothetical protein